MMLFSNYDSGLKSAIGGSNKFTESNGESFVDFLILLDGERRS